MESKTSIRLSLKTGHWLLWQTATNRLPRCFKWKWARRAGSVAGAAASEANCSRVSPLRVASKSFTPREREAILTTCCQTRVRSFQPSAAAWEKAGVVTTRSMWRTNLRSSRVRTKCTGCWARHPKSLAWAARTTVNKCACTYVRRDCNKTFRSADLVEEFSN